LRRPDHKRMLAYSLTVGVCLAVTVGFGCTDMTDRQTADETNYARDAPEPCPACGCLAVRFDGYAVECTRCRKIRA